MRDEYTEGVALKSRSSTGITASQAPMLKLYPFVQSVVGTVPDTPSAVERIDELLFSTKIHIPLSLRNSI